MIIRYIYILFFIVATISCGNSSNNKKSVSGNDSNIVIHPTEDNKFNKSKIASIVFQDNAKNSEQINNRGKAFLKRYNDKIKVSQIGVLDDIPEQIFSSIDDVVMRRDTLAILDRNNIKISMFTIHGKYIKSIGNQGRGPGEMSQPNGISLIGNDLYISDRLYSVKRVNFSSDNAKMYEFISGLNGFPEGICGSENSFVIKFLINRGDELGSSHIFHRYSVSTKESIGSFGESYKVDDLTAKEILSEGIFSCNADDNSFTYSLYALPYVFLYDLNRNIEWINRIDNFTPLRFRQKKGAGMVTRWDNSDFEYDEYRTLITFDNDILLQIERFENYLINGEIKIKSIGLRSYLINGKNGEGTFLGDDIPKILTANKEYLVLENEKNFPGINIYKL